MEPLVSIVVPIFKVEKYLRKCINSILNQTLSNIEVILVNDGCPNGCGEIIEEYKLKDNRVVTVHKKNGGQSSARNAGLEIARGKFIGFVDPDDWIEPQMYEVLLNAIASSNADVAVCGRSSYEEDGNRGHEIKPENKLFDFDNSPKEEYIIENFFYPCTASTCNKLYRRELIYNFNLQFKDVNLVGSEDALFNYAVLCNSSKVVTVSDILYNVLVRSNSTVSTFKEGYMRRTAYLIKCMHEYSLEYNSLDLYQITYPLIFLYFQQWNLDRINSLTNNNVEVLENELKNALEVNNFRLSCLRIALDQQVIKNMKKIGYLRKGILFIRIFMLLCYFNLWKAASKFRTMKR